MKLPLRGHSGDRAWVYFICTAEVHAAKNKRLFIFPRHINTTVLETVWEKNTALPPIFTPPPRVFSEKQTFKNSSRFSSLRLKKCVYVFVLGGREREKEKREREGERRERESSPFTKAATFSAEKNDARQKKCQSYVLFALKVLMQK